MNDQPANVTRGRHADSSASIIKIAVMAVGGQGGGVLTGWIAELARQQGYAVQMTSVAGVAQRTGATIYYAEMAPRTEHTPVFALNPSPGDVDVLIAAELMEAGRAILRGFVTEDKTTLIASTHRVLAVSEKQVPGDGRADAAVVAARFQASALKSVCFDMQAIAEQAGTMISASLFGALAKSHALPFEAAAFEAVIQQSGRGVEQSLAAFRAALAYDDAAPIAPPAGNTASKTANPVGPQPLLEQWNALVERATSAPQPAREMLLAGLRKTVDYQDCDYGTEYLDRVLPLFENDNAEQQFKLSVNAAKHIANAMCYDDILRVADLKTRSTRDSRVRQEQQAMDARVLHVTEYFHPRAEEFCATLPARPGRWLEQSPQLYRLLKFLFGKGRRVRTDGIMGFTLLWLVAGLRPFRRKLLRHRYEQEHLEYFLAGVTQALAIDYSLAVEYLQCQRLVKGYSDTHDRGKSKFKRVTNAALNYTGSDAASWTRRLREAALQDEEGSALDSLLRDRRDSAA